MAMYLLLDFTLYVYVTSGFPFISSCFKYHLGGNTNSARLCMAHASETTQTLGLIHLPARQ